MLKINIAVFVHLAVLAVACTSFSVIFGWTSGDWKCNFYEYRYADGWGYAYHSPYTLPVILAYLIAYTVGIGVYMVAWRAGSRFVAATGLALCVVGLLCFGIEGSHWIIAHNLSWIASFPAVMFPLGVVAIIQRSSYFTTSI